MNNNRYRIYTTDGRFIIKADGVVDLYDAIQFYNILQEERYLGLFKGTQKEKRQYVAFYIKKNIIGFEKLEE